MNVFEHQRHKQLKRLAPLAERMRPQSLEDFVGQTHIVGQGRLLRRAIEADRLTSVIFYGPPGTGKTTLARVIANTTKSNFIQLNAVTAGVKDIRKIVADAQDLLGMQRKRTILFIDEIHRFNRAQQDALLPSVEQGLVTLIGATTENPYFEVNAPLLSRSRIFQLKPLTAQDIAIILKKAISDPHRGYGTLNVNCTSEALNHFVAASGGDARSALNALELAVLTTEADEDGAITITLETAVESIQQKALNYDKNKDAHYDTISAFIKAMRGGEPDAAVYYLARMIEAGEDVRFIARRIVICAAEDVGNADPLALILANNAAQAVNFIGLPEARIILAQAAIYVACAEKSNRCYMAINKAQEDVKTKPFSGIPPHLQDASYKGAHKLGHGKGYKYPHDYAHSFVKQQYLPDSVKKQIYYKPSAHGYEKIIRKNLKFWWEGEDKADE